jgi:hypothetical protein
MADSLDKLRSVFDDLHRETAQKLQATTSQLNAAEQRLADSAGRKPSPFDFGSSLRDEHIA